jgi:hypothetical protein
VNHRRHIPLACLSACCSWVGAAPGGVALMTDTDNTGKKAVGEYADIRLECAGN